MFLKVLCLCSNDTEKSDGESRRWRELGNQAFRVGKDFAALEHYNEAVIHAPQDKQSFVLALANRSAAHARLEHWQEAQDDIKLALNSQVPHPTPAKLLERQSKCQKMLMEVDSKPALQMKDVDFQGSLEYPGLSPAVKICVEKDRGRFGIANRDIQAGEVLIKEEATGARLKQSESKTHCENCLRYTENFYFS